MEEVIAQRYIKALRETMDTSSIENVSILFNALAVEFQNESFLNIMENPYVESTTKESILLDAVKSASSDKLNNFISLLVENSRIGIIPAISTELSKAISYQNNSFVGKVLSDSTIDDATLKSLSEGISKKMSAEIKLEFFNSDFNGIKVEVDDLGIEVSLSKSRISDQLVEHILKAI
ncbi:MAG: F0F1 ATP synthase subunit delta [Helicobacteraceae bacterium]|nr:F0F1 ATP synthase subunit delta [Helicobacteraceae bacterium]